MFAILLFICKTFAVAMFGCLVSFFTLFLDMIIQPGMVAHFYLKGLAKYFSKKYNKEFHIIEHLPTKELRFEQHFNYAFENKPLFKMLGGCMPCSNVWHSIIISIPLLIFIHTVFEWWWIFPEIFISSFYLRFLMTKV